MAPAETRSRHGERGASLIGLLFTLIILGVMAAVAVSAVSGNSSTALPTLPSVTTTSVGEPSNQIIAAALSAACVADYETLSTALQVYEALHNTKPASGTTWVQGVESGSTLMEAWPSEPGHFTLTWNGSVLGVVPHRGAVSLDSPGSRGRSSGCYASLS
jgi:type II secretory pathway pseudopilin PulG